MSSLAWPCNVAASLHDHVLIVTIHSQPFHVLEAVFRNECTHVCTQAPLQSYCLLCVLMWCVVLQYVPKVYPGLVAMLGSLDPSVETVHTFKSPNAWVMAQGVF